MITAAPRRRILLLGAITALGSLAIHMFVPAMPRAAVALHTSRSAVQLALTFYLVSVAIGQIATGPLSDRVGRRPVLLGGAILFVAGSAMCWAAGSILALLAGRVVQALGASSGLVAGRAMVTDAASTDGARDMALLTAIVMLSPMLAPLLGNAIVDAAGWRAIFAVLAAAGALCGLAISRWLPESLSTAVSSPSTPVADWRRLMREPVFLRHLAIGTSLSGALYVFLAASPFLLVDVYHADPRHLGLPYGLVALGAGGGALGASAIAARLAPRHVMTIGTLVAMAGAGALLVGVIAGRHAVPWLIAPMMVMAFGGGMVTPNAMVAALAAVRGRAGTAVSIYGALQMAGSALATVAVAALPSHDPLVPALTIVALTAIAALLHHRRSPGS